MVFSKKYCPIWVYDCVVAQSVNDFILYGVDLVQPCGKFATGLSELFEEVSLEELVRASEVVVQFLVEHKINENSTDLLSNFSYYRFHPASKKNASFKVNPVIYLEHQFLDDIRLIYTNSGGVCFRCSIIYLIGLGFAAIVYLAGFCYEFLRARGLDLRQGRNDLLV